MEDFSTGSGWRRLIIYNQPSTINHHSSTIKNKSSITNQQHSSIHHQLKIKKSDYFPSCYFIFLLLGAVVRLVLFKQEKSNSAVASHQAAPEAPNPQNQTPRSTRSRYLITLQSKLPTVDTIGGPRVPHQHYKAMLHMSLDETETTSARLSPRLPPPILSFVVKKSTVTFIFLSKTRSSSPLSQRKGRSPAAVLTIRSTRYVSVL